MDHEEQKLEFEKIVTRARRGGLLKAHYPEHGIAILIVPPAPSAASTESGDPTPTPNPPPAMRNG